MFFVFFPLLAGFATLFAMMDYFRCIISCCKIRNNDEHLPYWGLVLLEPRFGLQMNQLSVALALKRGMW
jgi:hypothetical protein